MTKAKAKKDDSAPIGHNVQDERAQFEEQQFLSAYRQIKEHDSDMAGLKGEMAGIYERIKNIGFTKADVKWAKELEDKDAAEIIATMQRRTRWLMEAMEHLDPRERRIIERRHLQDERTTLEGVGAEMNICRERVRQIENRGMQKLRSALLAKEHSPEHRRP